MTFWRFRPAALSLANYATLSKDALVEQYLQDNERASKEQVQILPRSSASKIRTLQWNINAWANGHGQQTLEGDKGIIDSILNVDADVIVLNEYHWGDKGIRHETLEQKLRGRGYSFYCGTVFAPTAVATRFYVYKVREIRLSEERSALAVKVDNKDSETAWVIGTHLDFRDGRQRRKEIQSLLQDVFHHIAEEEPIIILGDLNQQRKHDYTPGEWERISQGMERRRTCHDDGVDKLLQDEEFICAWDDTTNCNWETPCIKPPSTHWSGTIVDYSYGRNVKAVAVSVCSIGSSWSDHRMIVCDWK